MQVSRIGLGLAERAEFLFIEPILDQLSLETVSADCDHHWLSHQFLADWAQQRFRDLLLRLIFLARCLLETGRLFPLRINLDLLFYRSLI